VSARAAYRISRILGHTLRRALASTLREPQPRDLSRWSGTVLRMLKVQVEVQGPLPQGATLWVANHLSWLDPLALLSLRPSLVLAKAEVGEYPFIGPLARRHGLRFVRRESLASRTAALRGLGEAMDAGQPVLVFPEGTTSRGHLSPLYRGSLCAAFRQGISILPLHLSSLDPWYPWVGEASLMPHLKAVAEAGTTTLTVRPGPILHPRDYDEASWMQAIEYHLGARP